MDLAPPPVGELYVSDEKPIAAANTWAEAHGYALIVSRSNKNQAGNQRSNLTEMCQIEVNKSGELRGKRD